MVWPVWYMVESVLTRVSGILTWDTNQVDG